MARILILGGTAEARALAARLSGRSDLAVTVSLAGRTVGAVDQKAPTRVGGFGGAAGLATYLRTERVDMLVDATHPYAAVISQNSVTAAAETGTPFLALRRLPWAKQAGDDWIEVATMEEAVAALGEAPRRVFLALGRKEIAPFEAAPQHAYLIRSVDPIEPRPQLPRAEYVVARGPFDEDGDRALLSAHAIERIVCRNSGGEAAYAKIAAARTLRLSVIIVRRPALPEAESVETVEGAVAWIDHVAASLAARGV